jgi:hypothetical protein
MPIVHGTLTQKVVRDHRLHRLRRNVVIWRELTREAIDMARSEGFSDALLA